jgi:AcrR family transcriptional regulator
MATEKRTGPETRAAAKRAAMDLFIAKGYDATTLREIAERLGINKASLYYHFAGKDDIVESIVADRRAEITDLLGWIAAQTQRADLLDRAILRWLGTSSGDKIRGIRFVNANPGVLRRLGGGAGALRAGFDALAEQLLGDEPDGAVRHLATMAFLSLNAAVLADPAGRCTDAELTDAAQAMAKALLRTIHERRAPGHA